jgi:hypothetical protein
LIPTGEQVGQIYDLDLGDRAIRALLGTFEMNLAFGASGHQDFGFGGRRLSQAFSLYLTVD